MLSKALYVKSITCVIDAPCMSIRICSKTVLSLLLVIGNIDKSSIELKEDETSRLVELMGIAIKEGEASEGLMTFTTADLLVSF